MSISSMRSKRTSRYKQQHQDSDQEDDHTFKIEEEIKEAIFKETPKKKPLIQQR